MLTRSAVVLCLALISCKRETPVSGEAEAHQLFQAELTRRGVKFERLQDGRYSLSEGDWDVTANLENVAKEFALKRDPRRISEFVDRALSPAGPPPWAESERSVFWVAEPKGHEFGTTLREPASAKIQRVLAVVDLTVGTVTWISSEQLGRWKVSHEQVRAAADRNIALLLEGKTPTVEQVEQHKLGFIPLNPALKASAVFSPAFRRFVEKDLGWPVLIATPCRDALFVLAERDKALLERMGGVIRDDYRECAYPLSTEILRVSDAGIEPIGSFPE